MAYKSHALKIGATWIGGVTSSQFSNDATVKADVVAGSAYPLFTSISEIKTGFRVTASNVATALTQLGFLGIALGGGTTCELWEILWDDNGSIATGSVHRKVVFANGRVIWRQIKCSNRQDATIDIEVFGLSADGAASPVAYTEAQAFPVPVDDARHTLRDVVLASIPMGCVTDITIDSGWSIMSDGCNSNVFDTRMDVKSLIPKITVTTLATQLVGSGAGKIPVTGLAATHANTKIQLRKRIANTGTFVADATTQHIAITSAGILVPTSAFSGSANDDATSTFELTSLFDGTNLPLVISAASAIS